MRASPKQQRKQRRDYGDVKPIKTKPRSMLFSS
jgi:hypothetical protein